MAAHPNTSGQLPRDVRELADRVHPYVRKLGWLADDLGRPPTVPEAEKALGLSRSNAHYFLEVARREYTWGSPTTERLWMLLGDLGRAQRQNLVGHALASVLGVSQFVGEDLVAKLLNLRKLGASERLILLMLEARRIGDQLPKEPPELARPVVMIEAIRARRAARTRVHPSQLALPIEPQHQPGDTPCEAPPSPPQQLS